VRWLLALGLPLGAVLLLSLWAIDKPNVVWRAEGDLGVLVPQCPLCRNGVRMYASRCPTCDQDVEWVVAPKDVSPVCVHCLSPGEAEALAARRKGLGDDVAAKRVAEALGLPPPAARRYLLSLVPGACGWCGGTGEDPARTEAGDDDCPVCFGDDDCIACVGDRRVEIGREDADLRLRHYEQVVAGIGAETPVARAREQVREANDEFLSKRAGTLEAQRVLFWPAYRERPLEKGTGASRLTGFELQPLAADRARERIDRVLRALRE
jgi:hypothetical protein